VQAEDGNSDDGGDGAGNIGGCDGAGRLPSTVLAPIYIQNRPFPIKISWGFIGKGRNLRICVWWCGWGRDSLLAASSAQQTEAEGKVT